MKCTSLPLQRREFITLLGGAAAAWPLAARAQQPAMPVIGFLRSTRPEGFDDREPVRVIVCSGTAAPSAIAATATVPIVFVTGSDPVRDGLVASFNRPGGNVTGISFVYGESAGKRLELLRQLVPGAATIGVMIDPGTNEGVVERRELEAAAKAVAQQLFVLEITSRSRLWAPTCLTCSGAPQSMRTKSCEGQNQPIFRSSSRASSISSSTWSRRRRSASPCPRPCSRVPMK